MTEIKIAICDDEQVFRDQIVGMASDILKEAHISYEVTAYGSGKALLEAISGGRQFHILLLDVMMPGGDGMELAGLLRQQNMKTAIIFISSNLDMALRGYEVSASRFLAKPLDREKLREAMEHCCRAMETKKEILLPTEQGQHRIPFCDIQYVEAFDRGTRFVLAAETVATKLKFSEAQEALPKNLFVLSHRAYLVNLAHVKRIRSHEFEMKTGHLIPISKYRYDEVSKKFFAYMED